MVITLVIGNLGAFQNKSHSTDAGPWLFVTIIILAIGHLSWRVCRERQAVTYQL